MRQLKSNTEIMLWMSENCIIKKPNVAREFFHAKSGKPSIVGASVFVEEMVLKGYLYKDDGGRFRATKKLFNWANRQRMLQREERKLNFEQTLKNPEINF